MVVREEETPAVVAFRAKMATEDAKQIYRKRPANPWPPSLRAGERNFATPAREHVGARRVYGPGRDGIQESG
jgi:hypothetical protein